MVDAIFVYILQTSLENHYEVQGVFTTPERAFKAALENERDYAQSHNDVMTFDYKEWRETGRGCWDNTTGTTDAWVVTRHELS